jgi:hypothetical protein
MEQVKLSNSLKQHNFIFGLIDKIVKDIKSMPKYELLIDPINQELTKRICVIIDAELKKLGDTKITNNIDINTIVQEVFKEVFPNLKEVDMKTINQQIIFLTENGLHKLETSFFKKAKSIVSSVLPKSSSSS